MFLNYDWHSALNNFLDSLQVMWKGMLGIFVVMGLLGAVVLILSKIPEKAKNTDTSQK